MRGTLTGQRYVDDILRAHVGPFLNGLPGAIFQQDNARPHTARVAQDFLRVLTLVSSVGCIPLNSKAAGWMSSAGEDSRSYSHLGGGSKFLMIANPYDVQVGKLQCIELVQKCMGTRLLDLKSETEENS
ncbi:DDE_3 domain-containing protein [Trichonephila clavipes]|nr:DDE_3 domain-containing protein [Trichonephila clavipes]